MPHFNKINKSPDTIHLLEEAVNVLVSVGIPINDKSERSLLKMAMAFLAVAGVTKNWQEASDKRFLKTREIINFINQNFEENISSGSYDDIRRKDLKLLVLAGLVLNSSDKPSAATNDPTRGYSLESEFKNLILCFGKLDWETKLHNFLQNREKLNDLLARKRDIEKISVKLSNETIIELSLGKHNELQKAIIEEFLPRYGNGCELLYVGDTSKKLLFLNEIKLKSINFFDLSHEELPDIIAYDVKKNWLYLIEAVHSSGSINEIRMLELKQLTAKCTAEIVYVTAFLTKSEFRKWVTEIAWETEVWIAENSEHLIHFNGDKFLGPYST